MICRSLSGSEVGKTPREVKQLKPILTNVYLRTSSRRTSTSSRDVIAGESILDKTGEGEEGPSRKRHSKPKREDLKNTLPKVSEVSHPPALFPEGKHYYVQNPNLRYCELQHQIF